MRSEADVDGPDDAASEGHVLDDAVPDGFVLDLARAGTASLRLVGGKALNLGKLTEAGFPVPRGFCLTTDAYRQAVPSALAAVAARLDGAPAGTADGGTTGSALATGAGSGRMAALEPADLERLAASARELILAAAVPAGVEAALRTAYAALGAEPAVAVRSSATAEDLPFASFAGQQDSFTGITRAEAVIDAVRRCWASLWSDRAVAYRSANGISHREVGLAVVVQIMVDAATAGVLFTANPVTGTRTETVINASVGAGQAVVSGAVNPDQFTVDTATAAVLRRARGNGDPALGFSLTDAELGELTRLGEAAQRLLGSPQDAEWVIDAAGKAWLTQSRPITTLYPLEDPFSGDRTAIAPDPAGGTRVYLCGTLLQGLTRPITPIGLAALGVMRNRKGPWRYVNPGLRMYVDLTAVVQNKWGRRYLTRMLPLADGRSAAIFPELLADPRFAVSGRLKIPSKARFSGGGSRRRVTEAGDSLGLILGLVPALVRAGLRPAAEVPPAEA